MVPKYNEMYDAVLDVLYRNGQLKLSDLVQKVADILNLTDEDRNATLENKKIPLLYYRIGWTKTYLTKAGLLKMVSRGIYTLTKEGKRVVTSGDKVTNSYLNKYNSFVEFTSPNKNIGTTTVETQSITPIENIDNSLKMISSRLSDELLNTILTKDAIFFEGLVLDLFDKMGYAFDKESIQKTSISGDEGIDGIVKEDKFGFNNIYVQAKRWTLNKVGRVEIQKFLGAINGQGGNKGLFITTSSFSKDAIEYAQKQLQTKIILVDGKLLTDLMIQYNLGVSVVKTYELKQLDSDYFDNELF